MGRLSDASCGRETSVLDQRHEQTEPVSLSLSKTCASPLDYDIKLVVAYPMPLMLTLPPHCVIVQAMKSLILIMMVACCVHASFGQTSRRQDALHGNKLKTGIEYVQYKEAIGCIDDKSRKELWRRTYATGSNPFVMCADESRVIIKTASQIEAVDTRNGKLLWHNKWRSRAHFISLLNNQLTVLSEGKNYVIRTYDGYAEQHPDIGKTIPTSPAPRPAPGKGIKASSPKLPTVTGSRWALLIGINKYATMSELKYCVQDARAIKDVLVSKGGYDPMKIVLLTDDQDSPSHLPTLATIKRRIGQITRAARENDSLIIAFSGHGTVVNDRGYLVPLDGDEDVAISMMEVRKQIEACKARQKVLILDTCHSGKDRGASSSGSQLLADADGKGFVTITSCDAGEKAYEDDVAKQGIFTKHLIEGLSGKADGNRDGDITHGELYEYTYDKVNAWSIQSGKEQHPKLIGTQVGKLVLAKVATRSESVPVHLEELFRKGMVAYKDGDVKTAIGSFKSAAEQGHAYAQYNLASCYENGTGVKKDLKQAVKWYTLAAEQNNADAECNLGLCYWNGEGVRKNPKNAIDWYTRAANHGNANAQFNLGISYWNGDQVPRDRKEARKWLLRASEQGHKSAKQVVSTLNKENVFLDP